MNGLWVIVLLVFSVIALIAVFVVVPEDRRCREAGGVRIHGTCVSKEVLR